MKLDRRLLISVLVPGLALGVWLLLGAFLFRLTLPAGARDTLDAALRPVLETNGMIIFGWWLIAAVISAVIARKLYETYFAAPRRLVDATRVLVGDANAADLVAPPGGTVTPLAEAINALAAQRRTLQADMVRLVEKASQSVAHERDQLGALMAELQKSVVVCNLEGRILLYNGSARALTRRLSQTPDGAGGAELLGLGRSIHSLVDRALIDHALETIERRFARGPTSAASAKFVTVTRSGHLLRVILAPVRPGLDQSAAMTGYVLLLDDITDEYEDHSRRDRELLDLTEASRASFASMQAALDMLEYPDLEDAERERFHEVVRDEVSVMSTRLTSLAASASQEFKTRWPLQDVQGADVAAAAAVRIEAETGETVDLSGVDESVWISVDSFALIQALTFLSLRVANVVAAPGLRLRLAPAGARAHLDLVFTGHEVQSEALAGWQSEPMQIGEERSPLSVRALAERHGGELWLEHDRQKGLSCFRFLLPLASEEFLDQPAASRPEFYDFDLFAASEGSHDLDERALEEIAYTVFDTETTGLDPGQGDEIIQIGATRIVNGRLLRGECFEQLVDPRRSIPEAGIPVHGITPDMVRGKPTIAEALPVFHAFASDTVLVGHNVAFDMRFLALKEQATGLRFDQPVLDTLLLSSIANPNLETHRLEAIAERLGVTISGRHTAAGDALATAEVFLRLLPLLHQHGIRTLGEAREASQKSYYARLKY